MNEHDDLVSRLTDAARRPIEAMSAEAVDQLERRVLAVADDRTITPVVLPPHVRRRRAVLVTAVAIGTAAAAVAIVVAVTSPADRSLTPAGSGQSPPPDRPTSTVAGGTVTRPSTTTPTSGPTSTAPGTSTDAGPATSGPPASAPPGSAVLPTTATNPPPTTGTRPTPTTTGPSSTAPAPTTTAAAPSTTITQQPLPAPTLTLSASRSGGTITFTWTRVGADGFGQYVLARVPAGGISTWPSGSARVVTRLRLAARGSVTVDVAAGEDRSFVLIALDGSQRVIAVSNVLTVPG
jgi:hypothetical protein